MTQYIRKYTLTLATPWVGQQEGPVAVYPETFVSIPQYVADLQAGVGSPTREALETSKTLRREDLNRRWESFSQGGGEWGRDFERGVGKIFTVTDLHVEFEIEVANNDMEDGGEEHFEKKISEVRKR